MYFVNSCLAVQVLVLLCLQLMVLVLSYTVCLPSWPPFSSPWACIPGWSTASGRHWAHTYLPTSSSVADPALWSDPARCLRPGLDVLDLKRKLVSFSHGQELGQCTDLASDWLFNLVQPIRSQFAC